MIDDLNSRAGPAIKGRKVLITGAAGSIGTMLAERMLAYEPEVLRLLDNDEERSFFLSLKYRERRNVRVLLGDVRDRERMMRAVQGIDLIVHAAALKHVGLGEYNPFEVVKTNLLALQTLIECAIDANVGKFVFTSSDKAVNPTNVMGGSKFIGERLVTSANAYRGRARTIFSSTRFGNVLGSAGSVVPVFRRQIAAGGPLTITHPTMTRFFMTLRESVDLVLSALALSLGGEIFVPKMHALRLVDLAEALCTLLAPGKNIEKQQIGMRHGEKLYEELFSAHELPRCLETERLLIVLPYLEEAELQIAGHALERAGPADYNLKADWVKKTYSSETVPPMDRAQVVELLRGELGDSAGSGAG